MDQHTESIAQEAHRIVHGERRSDYGPPSRDFGKTAKLWEVILGCPVSAEQVGLCMIAVKLSRELNRHKRDNLTDICGYALTVQMIAEETERRALESAHAKAQNRSGT